MWKFILLDEMLFEKKSVLIPDELQKKWIINRFRIHLQRMLVSFVCFVIIISITSANVRISSQIYDLFETKNIYRRKPVLVVLGYYILLGVAFQISGDTESARQLSKESVALIPDPYRNSAVKRLWLMR